MNIQIYKNLMECDDEFLLLHDLEIFYNNFDTLMHDISDEKLFFRSFCKYMLHGDKSKSEHLLKIFIQELSKNPSIIKCVTGSKDDDKVIKIIFCLLEENVLQEILKEAISSENYYLTELLVLYFLPNNIINEMINLVIKKSSRYIRYFVRVYIINLKQYQLLKFIPKIVLSQLLMENITSRNGKMISELMKNLNYDDIKDELTEKEIIPEPFCFYLLAFYGAHDLMQKMNGDHCLLDDFDNYLKRGEIKESIADYFPKK